MDDCRETWRWWYVPTRSVLRSKEVKAAQYTVKVGQFGLFVVLLGRISTGSSISAPQSTALPLVPLSTTLYHILAVSRLLSSRNLQVNDPLVHSFWKAPSLVVNHLEDHK